MCVFFNAYYNITLAAVIILTSAWFGTSMIFFCLQLCPAATTTFKTFLSVALKTLAVSSCYLRSTKKAYLSFIHELQHYLQWLRPVTVSHTQTCNPTKSTLAGHELDKLFQLPFTLNPTLVAADWFSNWNLGSSAGGKVIKSPLKYSVCNFAHKGAHLELAEV